jgi:hypothetical protein
MRLFYIWQFANTRRFRGITRNEEMYPDAEAFNPARWLEAKYPTYKEPLTQYPSLNGFSQFGFGQRTCQGVPIVEQDLFLAMGGMAWAFDINKKRRADGSEVPVHWDDFTPLLIAKPAPFEFDIVPRSSAIIQQLRGMWETGKGEDDVEVERTRLLQQTVTEDREREMRERSERKMDDDTASVGGSETSGPSEGGSESSSATDVSGMADIDIWA